MAHLITIALLLFAGSCYASQRIVGGNDAAIESYPSVVQVEFQGVASGTWSQNCGGVILNNIFVLSAANCFSGLFYEPSLRRIRAGSATRNSGGTVVGVQRAVNHPDFGVAATFDADITVIRLSAFLSFSTTIQQAFIPTPTSVIGDSQPVVITGWGSTKEGGQPSSQLQQAQVLTVNRNTCAQQYSSLPIPGVVTENMICTGLFGAGGRDSCRGDAGGPVFITNIIVGIISFGHGCGNATFPGVATNVIPFSEWVLQTTANTF